jgi:hypothetical protein
MVLPPFFPLGNIAQKFQTYEEGAENQIAKVKESGVESISKKKPFLASEFFSCFLAEGKFSSHHIFPLVTAHKKRATQKKNVLVSF